MEGHFFFCQLSLTSSNELRVHNSIVTTAPELAIMIAQYHFFSISISKKFIGQAPTYHL